MFPDCLTLFRVIFPDSKIPGFSPHCLSISSVCFDEEPWVHVTRPLHFIGRVDRQEFEKEGEKESGRGGRREGG